MTFAASGFHLRSAFSKAPARCQAAGAALLYRLAICGIEINALPSLRTMR